MISITAIMNLHREGLLAHPSIRSFAQCCKVAAASGLSVRRIAVLDRPDDVTERALAIHGTGAFDVVTRCDFGDLGEARNFGTSLASSDYVAFFDADDLWGDRWIADSVAFVERAEQPDEIVCHPEYMYAFTPLDFLVHSMTSVPNGPRSSFLKLIDSHEPMFDKTAILFANLYTSNSLARRSLYLRYPFPAVDRAQGFGVEDWWWNAHTLGQGVRHGAVPGTVHLVRRKPSGSLSQQNIGNALLPPLHTLSDPLLDWNRV